MQDIFLSYRREDSQGFARMLYRDLVGVFGDGVVFRDVDTLAPGEDFTRAIRTSVARCKVFLVLIGREWLDARDAAGARRIDDADDYVRIEVESALRHKKVNVIPVLVEGVRMPVEDDLPPSLQRLCHRNAIELDDARWEYDMSRLASTIAVSVPRIVFSPAGRTADQVTDEPTIVLGVPEPAVPSAGEPGPRRWPRRRRVVAGTAIALLLLVSFAVVAVRDDGTSTEAQISSGTSTSSIPVTVTSEPPTSQPVVTTVPAPTVATSRSPGTTRTPATVPPTVRTTPAPTSPPPTSPPTTIAPAPQQGQLVLSTRSGPPGTTVKISAGACVRPGGWTGGEIYFGLNNSVTGVDPVTGERWWTSSGDPWQDQLVIPGGVAPGPYTVWANCYASDPSSGWKQFYLYPTIDFTVT